VTDVTVVPLSEPVREGVRHLIVAPDDQDRRLDKFLQTLWPTLPRTRIFRLVRRGEVRVNGKRVQPEQRLVAGDDVRVPPVRTESPPPREDQSAGSVATGAGKRGPSAAEIQRVSRAIIVEDERLIAIDKPAGVAVHGGSGVSFGVIECLRAARPDEKLELVHRLDRDTSGILLVARKPAVLRALHALLRGDDEADGFDKRYLALLRGSWQLGSKLIDAPLRTDLRVSGERTVKVMAGGKAARSEFRPIQFFGKRATLMEVRIDTGRTHQIRVHAAYAGHPVAGDDKYGDREYNAELKLLGLRRMFLHAASLSFVWPDRGTQYAVSAPLPAELSAVISALERLPKSAQAPRKGRSGASRRARSDLASRRARAAKSRAPRP
jgi:23S rRNA pseudouridine955/2504/2580 synthase